MRPFVVALLLPLLGCSKVAQTSIEAEIIAAPSDPISFFDGEDYQYFYTQHGINKSEIHMVVYCKAKNEWARLLKVPTSKARFGYLPFNSPIGKDMAVSFDYRALQSLRMIDPLKYGLPDRVNRNQECITLHYKSFVPDPHAATVIPLYKSDLKRIFY